MQKFRLHLMCFCAMALATLACGEANKGEPLPNGNNAQPDASVLDAETSIPDANPTCRLSRTATTPIELAEGSNVRVALEATPANSPIEIRESPVELTVHIDDTNIWIKSAYGTEGTYNVLLALNCGDAWATLTLPISVHKVAALPLKAWSQNTEGPSAREHPILWFDTFDPQRLFLLGGFKFQPRPLTAANDLWTFNLESESWMSLQSTAPFRVGARFVPIPEQRAGYLYGGSDETQNITYSMFRADYGDDGAEWTEVTNTTGEGVILHGVVYDAKRARYLSVCGYTGSRVHCDVQSFHPEMGEKGSWRTLQVASGDKPSGRYGFFYALDPTTDRLIVFGGSQLPKTGNPVNPALDTWALELDTDPPRWVKLADGGTESPPGRRNGAFALDTTQHRLLIWGGTADGRTALSGLWALDLERGHENWTRIELRDEPTPRASCVGIFDAPRNRMLVGFGNTLSANFADLWAFQF